MKKSIRLFTAMLLGIILITGIFAGIRFNVQAGTTWRLFTGESDYTRANFQTLYENNEVSETPMITVFTHGYNSEASTWSNGAGLGSISDGMTEEQQKEFRYDPESLIEQLRDFTGAEMFFARTAWSTKVTHAENEICMHDRGYNELPSYFTSANPDFAHYRQFVEPEDENDINYGKGFEEDVFYYFHDANENCVFGELAETPAPAVEFVKIDKPQNTGDLYIRASGQSNYDYFDTLDYNPAHMIIVFQASGDATDDHHNAAYEELANIINRVAFSMQKRNNGVLPGVNLIAHSRGGVTNMLYAINFPKMVKAHFSMGTPYSGIWLEKFAWVINFDRSTRGSMDLLNPRMQDFIRNNWNNTVANNDIDAHAIAGNVGMKLVDKIVKDFLNGPDGKTYKGILIGGGIAIGVLVPGGVFLEVAAGLIYWGLYSNDYVFKDDLFINASSQLASGYDGFKHYNRYFMQGTYDITKLSAPSSFPVGHNLEARDKIIMNYIMANIHCTSTKFFGYSTGPDSYTISGVNLPAGTTSVEIPDTVDGKTVTAIDDHAFRDNFYGKNITTVTIPRTVTSIGISAFENCTELTTIKTTKTIKTTITNSLGEPEEQISYNVVFNTLPEDLTELHYKAFSGCVSLNSSITILDKVEYISPGAFEYCIGLESFIVDPNNTNFISDSGVIYIKDGIDIGNVLVCYPAGKPETYFEVPWSVDVIADYAFSGNAFLEDIRLRLVKYLGFSAFDGCSNLADIEADYLEYVYDLTLKETLWYDNNNDIYVSLGYVLLEYRGNESVVDLSTKQPYITIAQDAFRDNQDIITLYTGRDLRYIAASAFDGCENLKTVWMQNTSHLTYIDINSFDVEVEGRNIYVPFDLLNEYLSDYCWEPYYEEIDLHETIIKFNSLGGSACANITIEYEKMLALPEPKRTGYLFIGWFQDCASGVASGMQVLSPRPWDGTEGTTILYAKWKVIEYPIILYANGIIYDILIYDIEKNINLPTLVKMGYGNFGGWYDEYDNPVSSITAGTQGEIILYGELLPNTYTVTFNLNDGNTGTASLNVFSDYVVFDSGYTLPVPERPGYAFNGWKFFGKTLLYTDENGVSAFPWDIASNITLHADWTKLEYYIQVDANGTIYYAITEGISGSPASIEYEEFPDIESLFNYFKTNNIGYREGYKLMYFVGQLNSANELLDWDEALFADLGDNKMSVSVYLYYVKEVDFCINFVGYSGYQVIGDYKSSTSLPTPTSLGLTFSYWIVANVPQNSRFVGTHLAPGEVFNYTLMPDLSIGYEGDAITIWLEAVFDSIEVIITFSSPYGTTVYPIVIAYGYQDYLPTPGDVTGRIFNGWYTMYGGYRTDITDYTGYMYDTWNIISNCTLIADWDLELYQIFYYGLNSSPYYNPNFPNYYTIEDTIDLTMLIINLSGYEFDGWYSNDVYFTDSYKVKYIYTGSTGSQYLYAKLLILYTITFNSNGGSSCSSITIAEGKQIMLPYPTKGGHYGGLNDNAGGSNWNGILFNKPYIVSYSRTFTASWVEKPLSLLRNGNNFEVWTYKQFNAIRDYSYSSVFIFNIKANINLINTWTPITSFWGTINGGGYTINGLYMRTTTAGAYYGFIAYNYGTINSMKFSNVDIQVSNNPSNGFSCIGAVAGINYGTIYDCDVNSGKLFGWSNRDQVGGIVGQNKKNVDLCYVYGSVTIKGYGWLGGIVGTNYDSNAYITRCNFYGDIYYTYNNDNGGTNVGIGGITGYNIGKVNNCQYSGYIEWYSPGYGSAIKPMLGCIIGWNKGGTYTVCNVYGGWYYYYYWGIGYNQSDRCFKVDNSKVGYSGN